MLPTISNSTPLEPPVHGDDSGGVESARMQSRFKHLLIVLAVVALIAQTAHAVDVEVDFDPRVDFSRYRTLGWLEGSPAEDTELEMRIHAAIERELIPLGLREVRQDPELLIVTHAAMDSTRTIDVTQFEYWTDYKGWRKPLAVTADSWDSSPGVLIVDLLDAAEKRLIWRGVATGNVAKTSQRRGEKLDRTMAELFKGFPPKFKPGNADR